MQGLCFTTFFLLRICCNFDFTHAAEEEFRLLRHLLNETHYDRGVRPTLNSSDPVRIEIDIVLNQLIDMVNFSLLFYNTNECFRL